jgi:hypothetical protein
MPRRNQTLDPTQIQNPSQIPPPEAQPVGLSPQGLVDVYCGTLAGDIDAQPSAKELLGTALDTGGLSSADYIYKTVSALYGNASLPDFQSPSGRTVKSVVFVSGSAQGGYGAFHIGDRSTQADFDRIVVDSLNASGNYSAGSGLGSALAPTVIKAPRLLSAWRGPNGLLGVVDADDPSLKQAGLDAIRAAHRFAAQSVAALSNAFETRNPSERPRGTPRLVQSPNERQVIFELIQANQETLGLTRALARASGGRQYLSTALFAAEIVESFQTLTRRSDPGKTDGEAVSRVLGFKLAPEISLVPGFNSAVTQQWWTDGHPDFANVNTENDQSTDGNAAGMMFLLFLTDYLGISVDQIIQNMPQTDGAPLGDTYANLLKSYPDLVRVGGKDGRAAFQKMVSLLQNAQTPDGTLNLPANGNPFPSMPGAKQGGLFSKPTPISNLVAQDAQAALGLETQIEQQLASLKSSILKIQADIPTSPAPNPAPALGGGGSIAQGQLDEFGYGPPLPNSAVLALEQRVAPYRAPQYDRTLQQTFWKHVYNELPGTGPNTNRLQVITGTIQAPQAVQITGTIASTKCEPDGDLHIAFRPDDPRFPTNRSAVDPPLELEIIYACPVTQADAKQAQRGYTNPFNISQLKPGARIQVAGPLIFDRAHAQVDAAGNVQHGLEIHPLAGMTVLTGAAPAPPIPAPPVAASPLSDDVASALAQVATLTQALGNLTSLLQKMQREAPSS